MDPLNDLRFLGLGGYSLYMISTIKVNGLLYGQIITQKDLAADLLPPGRPFPIVVEQLFDVLHDPECNHGPVRRPREGRDAGTRFVCLDTTRHPPALEGADPLRRVN